MSHPLVVFCLPHPAAGPFPTGPHALGLPLQAPWDPLHEPALVLTALVALAGNSQP
jgi:hypothetical protein